MGESIRATASDGHEFDIYLAQSKGSPRGGIILDEFANAAIFSKRVSGTLTRPVLGSIVQKG